MTEQQPPASLFERMQAASKRMHSRSYFWFRSVGAGVGAVLVAALAVFIFSAVVFLWRERELGALPNFGWRGFSLLLHHFPWGLTIVFLVSLVLLLVMLYRWTPTYRWPVVLLAAFIFLASATFGFLASRSTVHGVLANRAIRGELPVFGRFYQPRIEDDHVVIGHIVEIGNEEWWVQTRDGSAFTVFMTDDTAFPASYEPMVGDRVIIIGDESGSSITADVFRPLPPPRYRPW